MRPERSEKETRNGSFASRDDAASDFGKPGLAREIGYGLEDALPDGAAVHTAGIEQLGGALCRLDRRVRPIAFQQRVCRAPDIAVVNHVYKVLAEFRASRGSTTGA